MIKNNNHSCLFLKDLRLRKKLNLRECAEKVGINYTYLGQIESGRRNFNYKIKHYEALKTLLCDSPEDVENFDRLGKYLCIICQTIYKEPLHKTYCKYCNSKRDIINININRTIKILKAFQLHKPINKEINDVHIKFLIKLIYKYRLERNINWNELKIITLN